MTAYDYAHEKISKGMAIESLDVNSDSFTKFEEWLEDNVEDNTVGLPIADMLDDELGRYIASVRCFDSWNFFRNIADGDMLQTVFDFAEYLVTPIRHYDLFESAYNSALRRELLLIACMFIETFEIKYY